MFKPKSQETLNNCTDKKKMFIIRSLKFRQEQYRCSSGFRRIQPDPEFKNSYVSLTGACKCSMWIGRKSSWCHKPITSLPKKLI